jgi:hypothetical protein
MDNKIFVSIASYKDPELQNTVDCLLNRADNPELVVIGICQQDEPSKFVSFSQQNIKCVNYNYIDSKGVGWARHHAGLLYNGEEYFLQLDSHIIMIEHWDTVLRQQMEKARAYTKNKCIFSMYPSGYHFQNNERQFNSEVALMTQMKFVANDWPVASGKKVNHTGEIVRSPFINAGFMFGDGSFYIDCPYDPDIYFLGEEILNSTKAFTHGYDFFNPNVHMCWHLYKLHNDPNARNWTVHWNQDDEEKRQIKWTYYKDITRDKLKKIFNGEIPDALGKVRTVEQYEDYIGFNLRTLTVIREEFDNSLGEPVS